MRPELSRVDVDKIARLYADLRRESLATGSIPITVRHIESMVRMAEANARMHLRPQVRADDIDMAIRVALESFIQSQKYSAMAQLRRSFGKYCAFRKDHVELLMLALNDLLATKQRAFPDQPCQIPLIDLETRARELSIFDVKPLFSSRAFSDGGFRLLPCGTRITKD